MSKATRKVDEQAAQVARMRRICSELDDVLAESERLRREIAGEAHRLSEAGSTPELLHSAASTTPEPAAERREPRVSRDRAN
jgi:hypothetical protein